MALTLEQQAEYRRVGHLTVPEVFTPARMDAAVADAEAWGRDFVAGLDAADRDWYLERAVGAPDVLRKLDQPVFHRPAFRALAGDEALLAMVADLIQRPAGVAFSQIFFKPPHGGGPKPVHQDNFYFGPNDREGMVTAWVALDAATIENGCLYFGDGSNNGPVYEHVAPADEPFNLQVPAEEAARHPMTPAPVPKGGVSFHHGNTLHQSSDNNSDTWRRAVAIHYYAAGTDLTTPALRYDRDKFVTLD